MNYEDIKINMPSDVKYIIDVLIDNNYEAFIVGGCVRDSLLNRKPNDWDITSNAEPNEVINIFENLGFKIIPTGLKHGTVTVVINNENFEITTYRIDGDYTDSRRPDKVEFIKSLKEDMARRDFTINAMAYNDDIGLVDYFEGLKDLKSKIIRCVGNAEDRLNEDNLRRLRAIRFACQLGFMIDSSTYNALSLNPQRLILLSSERIRDELCKILLSNNVSKGIRELWILDMLNYVIPELDDCYGVNQHNIHHDKDVFHHILSVVDNVYPSLDLRLSALLHDIGKPKCFTMGEDGQGHFLQHHKISADMSREILIRLKFDNKTIDTVCKLIYEHMTPTDLNNKSIKKLIQRVEEENIYNLLALMIADRKGMTKEYGNFDDITLLGEKIDKIINEKQPMTVKDLAINGYDLINLGFKQGKIIRSILNKLLEEVLENPKLNNKEYLLEKAIKIRL